MYILLACRLFTPDSPVCTKLKAWNVVHQDIYLACVINYATFIKAQGIESWWHVEVPWAYYTFVFPSIAFLANYLMHVYNQAIFVRFAIWINYCFLDLIAVFKWEKSVFLKAIICCSYKKAWWSTLMQEVNFHFVDLNK